MPLCYDVALSHTSTRNSCFYSTMHEFLLVRTSHPLRLPLAHLDTTASNLGTARLPSLAFSKFSLSILYNSMADALILAPSFREKHGQVLAIFNFGSQYHHGYTIGDLSSFL